MIYYYYLVVYIRCIMLIIMANKKIIIVYLIFIHLFNFVVAEIENFLIEDIESLPFEETQFDQDDDPLIENFEKNISNWSKNAINDFVKISKCSQKKIFFKNTQENILESHPFKQPSFMHGYYYFDPSSLWMQDYNEYLVIGRFSNYINSRIYVSLLDENWNCINITKKLGSFNLPGFLPVPPNLYYSDYYAREPKIIRINGNIFVIYILTDISNSIKTVLFSFETGKSYILKIDNNDQPSVTDTWSTLIIEDRYLMLYNHKNMQVLNCTNYDSGCILIFQNHRLNIEGFKGGSSFTRYRAGDYYVSFSLVYKKFSKSFDFFQIIEVSRPVLTIIKATPLEKVPFRLIYFSNIFDLDYKLFEKQKKESDTYFDLLYLTQFLKITSFTKWDYDNDLIEIIVSLIDGVNLVVELKGLVNVVDAIIYSDEKNLINLNQTRILDVFDNYKYFTREIFNKTKKPKKKSNRKSRKEKRQERHAKRNPVKTDL